VMSLQLLVTLSYLQGKSQSLKFRVCTLVVMGFEMQQPTEQLMCIKLLINIEI
jgi:hypothetical protein